MEEEEKEVEEEEEEILMLNTNIQKVPYHITGSPRGSTLTTLLL